MGKHGLTIDHEKSPDQPKPKTGETPGLDAERHRFMAEGSEHPLALGETTVRNLDELGNPGFDRKKKTYV